MDRFGELWIETQEELLGDSVEITEGYRSWWSYVPHFIATPGYVYAYAYGQLLALSVYRLYLERGEEIVPSYLEMLAAGGSRSPEELGAIVGVDLTDPGFWDSGLELPSRPRGLGASRRGPHRLRLLGLGPNLVAEQVDQAVAAAAEAVICRARGLALGLVAVARGVGRVPIALARLVAGALARADAHPSRAPAPSSERASCAA